MMTNRTRFAYAGIAIAAFAVGWLLFVGLPRWYAPGGSVPAEPAAGAEGAAAPGRKIKARLFYLSKDGMRLAGVEREVPFGEGTVEQAKRILEAQFADPRAPELSAIPPGTALHALYVTDRGEAFVDVSPEITKNHPGGSLNELLTVYTIVSALTANLPAISAVQILVDGREADTLAGHVDTRRPLERSTHWLEER